MAVQLLAVSAAYAGDHSKPYLTSDGQKPTAVTAPAVSTLVAHQNDSDLGPAVAADVPEVSPALLEKLMLHTAYADLSAFGLLHAWQQPTDVSSSTLPAVASGKPIVADCTEARKPI
jgi:hypothetical protein